MGISRRGFSKILKPLYNSIDNVGKLGAKPTKTGLSLSEDGFGDFRKSTFTFTDMAIAMADEAGVVAYGSQKLYTFPLATVKIFGARADIALTKSSAGINATWDGDFGLGSTAAGNNAALATTEQNIIPTTATPQAVSGATTAKGNNIADIAVFDGNGSVLELFLNFLIDDADHDIGGTPGNLILNGTVEAWWFANPKVA
jgi:hypothetical protein